MIGKDIKEISEYLNIPFNDALNLYLALVKTDEFTKDQLDGASKLSIESK